MNAKKNNATTAAAKTTVADAEQNRSQAIREFKASNPNAKQSEIVAGLKKQGVEVTSSLVSSVLRRGTSSDRVNVNSIKEAATFIRGFKGGIDEAKKAIETVGQFVETSGGASEALAALDAYAALAAAIK
jgi:hypothetical protein